jgi:hypothetical protein
VEQRLPAHVRCGAPRPRISDHVTAWFVPKVVCEDGVKHATVIARSYSSAQLSDTAAAQCFTSAPWLLILLRHRHSPTHGTLSPCD